MGATQPRLSLLQYLTEAKTALAYVQRTMDIGASNQFLNNLSKLAIPVLAVRETRRQEDQYMKAMRAQQGDWSAYIEAMAMSAKSMGAGNCGEQASLAFWRLKNNAIRPIDFVCFSDRDHAFVVVGSPVPIKPNNFREWCSDSVTCDPWHGRADVSGMLAVHYPTTCIETKYRLE